MSSRKILVGRVKSKSGRNLEPSQRSSDNRRRNFQREAIVVHKVSRNVIFQPMGHCCFSLNSVSMDSSLILDTISLTDP